MATLLTESPCPFVEHIPLVQAIGDEDEHQAGVAGFSERPQKMRNIVSVEVKFYLLNLFRTFTCSQV